MSSVARALPSDSNRVFYHVDGRNRERMGVVAEIFHRILTPLYGSQEKAIRQIEESSDRSCFLLYENEDPSGVLVFKTVLSDEFKDLGVARSIEVKSLFVDNSHQNSGKGLGSCLVDKLKEEVPKLGLDPDAIHVTVSETKQESLMFFQKKGFQISHAWKDRYQAGVTEFLLSYPLKLQEAGKGLVHAIERVVSREGPVQGEARSYQLLHVIHGAHLDDIHALKKLSDGTFISGSKDNCIYKWSKEGELVKVVDDVEPIFHNDRNWITAIEVINDNYWLSGERNGKIFLWKTNGDYVKEVQAKRPRVGRHIAREENAQRANCFARGLDPHNPSVFIGFPTLFDEYSFMEGRTQSSTKVHDNDWVYSIHPLNEKTVLTVVGCTVDVWSKQEERWNKTAQLVKEGKKTPFKEGGKTKFQRPFISSLKPLASSPHHFGLALFDGSVKVLDIEQQRIVKTWQEHRKRVWAIENISENTFASCGEDRTIKLWDQRADASVLTIGGHIGQVTTMLNLEENVLIAGTCSEEVGVKKSAEIRFYDIRR